MKIRAITFAAATLFPTLLHAQTPPAPPSLTPPGAPAGGVFKTLDEIEPRIPLHVPSGGITTAFSLNKPGSYYLTSNVTLSSGAGAAFNILSSNVVLDLNGFSVTGNQNNNSGILIESGSSAVVIRNGIVEKWKRNGILDLTIDPLATTSQIGTILENVILRNNGADGCRLGANSKVENCTAFGNAESGISIASGRVTDCTASENTLNGIKAGNSSLISHCNTHRNGRSGIFASNGSTVSNCVSGENKRAGIEVLGEAVVSANNCRGNKDTVSGTAVGILVSGRRSRVEDNSCFFNNIGIKTEGAVGVSNFFAGNTCAFNLDLNSTPSNYSIQSGNHVGIIIVPAAGSSTSSGLGPGATAVTSPWANFSF